MKINIIKLKMSNLSSIAQHRERAADPEEYSVVSAELISPLLIGLTRDKLEQTKEHVTFNSSDNFIQQTSMH